jgi:hypothetical protein
LIGVFVRHDTSYLASNFTPLTPGAWFTIMGGLWEMLLCGVLLLIVQASSGIWKALAVAALWIGILEGAQISVCRAMIIDISAVPQNVNLCDYVTGWHVGAIMTGVYLFIVCMAIGKEWRKRENDHP